MHRSHAAENIPSTVDMIPDSGSGAVPSFGELGLSSVTNSRCELAVENESHCGTRETVRTR